MNGAFRRSRTVALVMFAGFAAGAVMLCASAAGAVMFAASAAGAVAPPQAAAGPAPRVVVSVLPVHSLAAGVMAGVGAPRLLIRGAASPHDASLRPSDARALSAADLVIWVGPGLETFLSKPLGALAGRARVIALAEALARDGTGAPAREPRVLLSAHPERWPRGAFAVLVQSAVDGGVNLAKTLRAALA